MKKFIIIISLFFTISIVYSQKINSKWASDKIVVDGNNDDWIKMPSMFDAGTKMLYEFRNDDQYLYLIFELTDKMYQKKFMKAGFHIGFKIKTKPKLDASIDFLPQNIGIKMSSEEERNDFNEIRQLYLLKTDYAKVNGFLHAKSVINRNIDSSIDFTYNIGWTDNKNMIVEIKVPINEFYESPEDIDNFKTPIKMTYVFNAMRQPSKGEYNASGGMGRGNSRGGMKQGGRPGGGMRRGGSNMGRNEDNIQQRQNLFSEQKIKFKLFLNSVKK